MHGQRGEPSARASMRRADPSWIQHLAPLLVAPSPPSCSRVEEARQLPAAPTLSLPQWLPGLVQLTQPLLERCSTHCGPILQQRFGERLEAGSVPSLSLSQGSRQLSCCSVTSAAFCVFSALSSGPCRVPGLRGTASPGPTSTHQQLSHALCDILSLM